MIERKNEKKPIWVFLLYKLFQKYSKFWTISLDNFIKHKPLISEEWQAIILFFCDVYLLYCISHFRPQRANISIGTARGLNYLHSQTPCVVHGDIKSTNILLDCHFEPKIADFGITTCNFKNKICELDMDVKSIDTYCYGVILFEMVTGIIFFLNLYARVQFENL